MIVYKDEMKEMEKTSGLNTDELILLVGQKCFEEIKKLIDKNNKILIIYGKGNNGEDGKAINNNLLKNGYNSELIFVEDVNEYVLGGYDVLIDCIFGFSFHLPLSSRYKEIFKIINNSNKTIISIDLNSGIEADTGSFDEEAIRSKHTLILGHKKICHALHKNSGLYENEILVDLPLGKVKTKIFELNDNNYKNYLPVKKEDAHKNTNGRLLLFGGSYGLAGSLALAGKCALSSGTSYLHILIDERSYPIVGKNVLSAVYHFYPNNKVLDFIDKVDAIGIGMGGDNYECFDNELFTLLKTSNKPILIDAYGLRTLSKNMEIIKDSTDVVLTPHLGEFSALINKPVKEIKNNLLVYAMEFVKKYNVTLVLKSPNTIVCNKDYLYINQTGNNKLAKAGSGDCLSGIIASLLSQNINPFIASCLGVYLHGKCADISECHQMSFTLEDVGELLKKAI